MIEGIYRMQRSCPQLSPLHSDIVGSGIPCATTRVITPVIAPIVWPRCKPGNSGRAHAQHFHVHTAIGQQTLLQLGLAFEFAFALSDLL